MNTPEQKKNALRHRQTWTMPAPRRHRRGVLLLVILSMLVIFLMTAVAFVVVSRSFHRSAQAISKIERLDGPAQDLLEGALYDILRDTENPHSRVRYHSLLRDMYGDDGFIVDNDDSRGELVAVAVAPGTDGQFLELRVRLNNVSAAGLPLSRVENYYNGHVLTMLDGPAAGLSTRIVSYSRTDPPDAPFPTADFRVLAFKPDSQGALPPLPRPRDDAQQRRGDRFVVNGRPFNGTGIGYNRNGSGYLDLTNADGQPFALVPNLIFSDPGNNPLWFSTGPGAGGSDEGYDAPDYQNMLLAYVPMDPTIPSTPAPSPGTYQQLLPAEVDRIVQPSLHRRELVNYWMKQLGHPDEFRWNPIPAQVMNNQSVRDQALADAVIARRVILRPLVADHPKFPRLASLINGPWDVDNDGDGVPDSIWVDLGYPPVKTPDGRFYKPMFAILVQDLDGRLNLNAHGTREPLVEGKTRPPTDQEVVVAGLPGEVKTALELPAGQGYGPAEVSLWPLFVEPLVPNSLRVNDYLQLLGGGTDSFGRKWLGRYGLDQWPGSPANRWDILAQMKFWEYPITYLRPSDLRSPAYNPWPTPIAKFIAVVQRGFMTPPDLRGQFGLGVEFNGFPNYLGFVTRLAIMPGNRWAGGMAFKSPYEKNLLEEGPRTELAGRDAVGQLSVGTDALFTEGELEKLLRPYDGDVGQIPERLVRLLSIFADPSLPAAQRSELLRSVTTRSFNVPMPSVAPIHELQQDSLGVGASELIEGTRPNNVADLLWARLMQNGVNLNNMPDDQRRRLFRQLLSPDLLDNLPLDINRPFGDGRDSDGNGAVDDPGEARYPEGDPRSGHLVGPLRGGTAITAAATSATDAGRVYGPVPLDLARMKDEDVAAINPPPPMTAHQFAQSNARQIMARHLYVLLMLLKDPDFVFEFNDPLIDNNPDRAKAMTALRLAQWAVNAVDFRDADSIMTGFEVDLDPFSDNDGDLSNGTWDVDGNLSTIEDLGTLGGLPRRQVVWGMERPDLLITETLAMHDLRLIDSAHDTGPRQRRDNGDGTYTARDDDNDLDQFRRPQGSLFVELLCAANPTNAVMPGELYRFNENDGQWHLDLERTPYDTVERRFADTPNDPPRHPLTGEPDPNPVWRLAISEPLEPLDLNANVRHPIEQRLELAAAVPPWEIELPQEIELIHNPQNPNAGDFRYVWFSRHSPEVSNHVHELDRNRIFWNVGGPALVAAGQYAVVGPRPATIIGSRPVGGGTDRQPSNQRIVLPNGPGGAVQVRDNFNNASFNTITPPVFAVGGAANATVKAATGIIAGIPTTPPGWTRPTTIGLNISEPLPGVTGATYYAEPTHSAPGLAEVDAYGDEDDASAPFPDRPMDLFAGGPLDRAKSAFLIGTHVKKRLIFLQRLADPTLPWNPPPAQPDPLNPQPKDYYRELHDPRLPVNPYITIDWQWVDLTVYNGEDFGPPPGWGTDEAGQDQFQGEPDLRESAWIYEDEAGGGAQLALPYRFAARERGVSQDAGAQGNVPESLSNNVWRAESTLVRAPSQPDGSDAFFKYALRQSLGYVNSTFGGPLDPGLLPTAVRALNLGAPSDPLNPGQAPKPFPWLVWNDRPFVSQYELMQVPMNAPGRLGLEHTVAADGTFDPYDASDRARDLPRYTNLNATFGHLLNFFAAGDKTGVGGAPKPAPHFYRLLEYVGVPSRFVGTETFLNPVVFSKVNDRTELRRPPFNRISAYREPGKVNLNTIFSRKVYQGLMHDFPEGVSQPGPDWAEFVMDRRGYEATIPAHNDYMFAMNDRIPTFFAGLYGPPDAGHLVPLLEPSTPNATASDNPPGLWREGVDMGLLRRDRIDDPTNPIHPLFRDHSQPVDLSTDPDRHPYFRYHSMQRLANLTTTRSNVYAVWITAGFFEMEPVPAQHRQAVIDSAPTPQAGQVIFDKLYPEGMWLTQEAGSDTGQVERYRGFYIIDRSIPVAFEPGTNHNVDQAVLVRRRIE